MYFNENGEEESCATCKFWGGKWWDKTTDLLGVPLHSGSYGNYIDEDQETFGKCLRHPPQRTRTRELRDFYQVVKWAKLKEEMEERCNRLEDEIAVAEKDIGLAKDEWDKNMAIGRKRKAEAALSKLEKRIPREEPPQEKLVVGEWIQTSRLDWCGDYKKSQVTSSIV